MERLLGRFHTRAVVRCLFGKIGFHLKVRGVVVPSSSWGASTLGLGNVTCHLQLQRGVVMLDFVWPI